MELKVYNFIKERREELGLTQRELAYAIGMGQSTYSKFENTDFEEIRVCDLEMIIKQLFSTGLNYVVNRDKVNVLNLLEELVENAKTQPFSQESEVIKYKQLYETQQEINKALREENDEFLEELNKQIKENDELKEEIQAHKNALKTIASII